MDSHAGLPNLGGEACRTCLGCLGSPVAVEDGEEAFAARRLLGLRQGGATDHVRQVVEEAGEALGLDVGRGPFGQAIANQYLASERGRPR